MARGRAKRDLFQGIKGTVPKAEDIDPILRLLCDHGYIRQIEMQDRNGPGRKPSQRYDVHPLFFADASHNSHNSHNLPSFTATRATAPTDYQNGHSVDVDYSAVRQLLDRGDEQRVRQECATHGLNADLVIAQAKAITGFRAMEGF